jgi:hypothetical protein
MKRSGWLVLLVLLGGESARGQSSPVSPVVRKVAEAVDARQALETVKLVYANDRWFTFPKFQQTVGELRTLLERNGAAQVEVGALRADGVTKAGFWTAPLAWDVASASLEMTAPERMTLCNYRETPACLGMWSGPTPAAGVEAELVDLDNTPWSQVRGKLVLTSQNAANLKEKLAQHGALGAVNGFSENPELGNDRQWINAWGDYGWGFLKTSTPLLSYSVTPNQATKLRALLAAGQPVRLRARAATRYYEGDYPWVTAMLPGAARDGEEVLALGHIAEQGAQDNATGVAATVEALRTLQRLIASGQLPRPRRSIRVLLMPELYGSLHYIQQYPERMAKTVAAITVDTPAASYDLAGTEYTAYKNPHVAKSWTDVLIQRIARATLPRLRPFRTAEHETGTDAYLGDPTIGVPNVWLYSGTGTVTHHNSADVPATVDLRSLGDLTAMVATYLYVAANAGEADIPWLASLIVDGAAEDVAATGAAGMDAWLAGDKAAAAFALARLHYLADRSRDALDGLRKLGAAPAVVSAAAHIRTLAAAQAARLTEQGVAAYRRAEDAEGGKLVVRRKRIGTIPLDELTQEQREGFPSGAWDKMVTVALYWCDGKRTVDEVARLTEFEMGRPLGFRFGGYFRFLERKGYVEFVR